MPFITTYRFWHQIASTTGRSDTVLTNIPGRVILASRAQLQAPSAARVRASEVLGLSTNRGRRPFLGVTLDLATLSPLVREFAPPASRRFTTPVEKCRKVSNLSKIVETCRNSAVIAMSSRSSGNARNHTNCRANRGRRRGNLAYRDAGCSGRGCGYRQQVVSAADRENANRLLTGDAGTIDIIQYMEAVCD